MESVELFDIKRCWGNFAFDYVHSASVGNSCGILCVWDTNSFMKLNATVSDYFVMVRGTWVTNGKVLLIISLYAPQELTEKKLLWDYLCHVIANWKGKVIVMEDFNEVRNKNERFGSIYNVQGANAFNSFISSAGLEEVPLGGCSFTRVHRSASKMTIVLKKYLPDHRPMILRESTYDYGPIPFRFFHYWFEVDGFEKLVNEAWYEAPVDASNAIVNLMYKLKCLKKTIRAWNGTRKSSKNSKYMLKTELADLDVIIDKEDDSDDIISKRTEGDHLSLFLFILIMESLHISFQRVVDAGMFKVIVFDSSMHLSHMFYADDAVFVGSWSNSNIDTIVHVLKCFHRASGLSINMSKSKIMGIAVNDDRVEQASEKNWIVDNMATRLLEWKMKTLSIGGRLTLLQSVLGSMPIYHMSIFKVPMKVLQRMESIRKKLGNGANTFFWEDVWRENTALKHKYPRLYALELNKNIEVAAKLAQTSLIEGVSLGVMNDRWTWAFEGSGDFSVTSVRKLVDDRRLPVVSSKTH
nr:RNA-directed DNA polymerase, eukaryota [Tanacetum cinerariifolium]